jgi:hypothetical protein
VYKQKVKHLLYEHQNNITALKARIDSTLLVRSYPVVLSVLQRLCLRAQCNAPLRAQADGERALKMQLEDFLLRETELQ